MSKSSHKDSAAESVIFADAIPNTHHRGASLSHHTLIFVFASGRGCVVPADLSPRSRSSASNGNEEVSQAVVKNLSSHENAKHFEIPLRYENRIVTPRKIILSPDRSLLLVLGAVHENALSLLIYKISTDSAPVLELVYNDLSLTFIDVCFTPDSAGIACIPHMRPSTIVMLNITSFIYDAKKRGPAVSDLSRRSFGPLSILGPVLVADVPVPMVGISCNKFDLPHGGESESCHFVTWPATCKGEVYLWTLTYEETNPSYRWERRFLLLDQESAASRMDILDAQFSAEGDYLALIVQKPSSKSGVTMGLMVASLPSRTGGDSFLDPLWMSLSEYPNSPSCILNPSDTLALGTHSSFLVTVQGHGIYEWIPPNISMTYLQSAESAVGVQATVQIGRTARFWVDKFGYLHSMKIATADPSERFVDVVDIVSGVENNDTDVIEKAKSYGYEIRKSSLAKPTPETQRRNPRKGKQSSVAKYPQVPVVDCVAVPSTAFGLSLACCSQCGFVLLRPLRCGKCNIVSYCSKECQREHWGVHSQNCGH
eukprot:TRINITY_DN9511_c0_g1_i1.p1 TRINITY_DN9511_c0_g1~~TRINITY_DN9511_c0_g1_i1.p1  ORF type:complete len:540 (+),score=70.76 TRINITY_DN9511_c0_g1_i1:90-1709(+)